MQNFRYSLRSFLVFVAICGVLSWTIAAAFRGAGWAQGMVWGVGMAICMLIAYWIVFGLTSLLAWFSGAMLGEDDQIQPESPFATERLPQQITPPRDHSLVSE